jgi:DNA-binding YbaB/EbfC family protein
VKQFGHLMKQAQKMQSKLMKLQEEAAQMTAEATAGGGMVKATANAKGEIVAIKIDRTVVDPEDVGMLEDLVTAAVNEAVRKAKDIMTTEVQKLTGGLGVPGLF